MDTAPLHCTSATKKAPVWEPFFCKEEVSQSMSYLGQLPYQLKAGRPQLGYKGKIFNPMGHDIFSIT